MFGLSTRAIFFLMIIVGVILEVLGDVFFKKWSLTNRNALLIIGLIIYFSGAYFWAMSLKYEYLSKAASIFTLLNLILAALIGIFYFNETLSLVNKIGIALGAISIVLIEF